MSNLNLEDQSKSEQLELNKSQSPDYQDNTNKKEWITPVIEKIDTGRTMDASGSGIDGGLQPTTS